MLKKFGFFFCLYFIRYSSRSQSTLYLIVILVKNKLSRMPEYDVEMVNMLKIICSILNRPESIVFAEPVDWEGLGLIDYPEIILHPMDLGTIKKKIENNDYKDVADVASDVRLVWSNCMLYNRDGSEYYHLADSFSRNFEDSYANLRKVTDCKSDTSRVPTLDERMQLSHDIFKIDNNELARVLTMIEESCPYALSRKASSDEVLINFDALIPSVFHDINAFTVQSLLSGNNLRKKKKADNVSSSMNRLQKKAR